jgi:hypothetical protein
MATNLILGSAPYYGEMINLGFFLFGLQVLCCCSMSMLLFQQKHRNLVLCLADMMWQWLGMTFSECNEFTFIQWATHNNDTAAIVGITVAGMAGQNDFYGAVVDSHADQVHCGIESEGNSCSSHLLLIQMINEFLWGMQHWSLQYLCLGDIFKIASYMASKVPAVDSAWFTIWRQGLMLHSISELRVKFLWLGQIFSDLIMCVFQYFRWLGRLFINTHRCGSWFFFWYFSCIFIDTEL